MKTLLVSCFLAMCVAAGAAPLPYHVIKTIPLGGNGGWDYLTVDSQAHRLYLSRSTHVMVMDLVTDKVVGDIPDTPGVHGIALAPDLGRGFTSNGRANTSTIFDLKTLKVIGHVKTGTGPDAIVYDPATKRVFTFNGGSKNATAIDAATGQVLATIPLAGRPEFAVANGSGLIYVNIVDTGEVVELDSRTLTVKRRFSLKPGEHPTGITCDASHHYVFSVCRNGLMTVLDPRLGKVIATVPIGAGPDAAAFDPGAGLVFSSNGEGTVTVVGELTAGKFTVVQTVKTQRGARTMAFDPQTDRIYLPTARFGPTPAPIAGRRYRRPNIINGSFVLLVVGR